MKKVKSIVSVALVGATMLSMAGCAKKFEAIDHKDFESALEDALNVDEDDIDSVKDPDGRYSFSYYSNILDGSSILDDYEISYEAEYQDGNNYYYFIEFDNEDDAIEWFEDEWYDDFKDMVDDKDYDGKTSYALTDNMGYILFSGETDSDDFFDSDFYGGIYVKDNIFIAVFTLSDKKSNIEDIDAFLDAIDYPKP